jgi:hypothetical protein
MASKASIAIRRDTAIAQCQDAIRILWGEEFSLPLRHRDPSMLGMVQMQAVADFLTRKAQEAQQPELYVGSALLESQTVPPKRGRKAKSA